MDFTEKNRVSFYDFQRVIMAIQFPESTPAFGDRMRIKDKIREPFMNALRHSMAIYPRHSRNPTYQSASLSESRFKPLITGIRMAGVKDGDLYYLNKAGKAYGFHIENAFIALGAGAGQIDANGQPGAPLKKGLIVTLGVYVNKDRILNNNRYQYQRMSVPTLTAMGYAVGRYLLDDPRFAK